MDCPNCSESFRLRADYATHLAGCMPRMMVDTSRGLLVTEIRIVREDECEPVAAGSGRDDAA